jgi:hypothetical protein
VVERTEATVPALRLTVLVGSFAWVTCIAVVHMVRADLDPRHVPVSSYLHGPYSGVARVGGVCACVALLALAALLRGGQRASLVPAVLVVAALATFVGTVVAPRPDEGAGSWGVASAEGAVHLASAGLAIVLVLTAMILSVPVRTGPAWSMVASTMLTLVALAAFAGFLADLRRADMERVTLALTTAWAVATAIGARGPDVVRPSDRAYAEGERDDAASPRPLATPAVGWRDAPTR